MGNASKIIKKNIQETPVPRKVIFNKMALMDPVLWLAFISWFGVVIYSFPLSISAVAELWGEETLAVITDFNEKKYQNEIYYEATILYVVDDQDMITKVNLGEKPEKGEKIYIKFLKGFEKYPNAYYKYTWFVLMWPVGFVMMCFVIVLMIRNQRWLLMYGIPVIGKVVGKEVKNGTEFSKARYYFRGKKYERNFSQTGFKIDEVVVLVNPEKPQKASVFDYKYPWKLYDNK